MDFKPMPGVGRGACETRTSDENKAFRVIYAARLEDAVFVLHAFQKKTRRTAKADVEVAARRFKSVGAAFRPVGRPAIGSASRTARAEGHYKRLCQ